MKRTIILNAGHSINDPGAVTKSTTEAKEVIKIRDKLIPLLKQDFDVAVIPDDLNFVQSIAWVNNKYNTLDDGLAISLHLNAGGGYGAETYYYAGYEPSRKIAQKIIDKYCALTRYRNRGAKPDNSTRHGKLGWIRDIKPWSCLIECCFIDNDSDLKSLQEEYDEVAWGIYCGICDVYNIKPTELNKIQTEIDQAKTQSLNRPPEFKFKNNPLDKIYITQKFGERPEVYKQWGMAGHNGVDFRTRFDDSLDDKRKVYAVLGGVVSEAITKIKDDYGRYVRLTHGDGSTTLYAHLDSLSVVHRQEIKAGDVIGISDNTHLTPAGSTGSHLHFGYRPANMNWHNGYKGYEDPEALFV